MDSFAAVLVLAALAAGGFGLVMLSNAMRGVGFIGLGCLMAIFARMAQASAHHHELLPHDIRSAEGEYLDAMIQRR